MASARRAVHYVTAQNSPRTKIALAHAINCHAAMNNNADSTVFRFWDDRYFINKNK